MSPLLFCLFAMAMMSPGGLSGREDVPNVLRRMAYDESDLAALALRGANAEWGRLPGRMDEPQWREFDDLKEQLKKPSKPAAERYYLEYPTPTLIIFRLGYRFSPLPPPEEVHSAIQDAQHVIVAYHQPTSEKEKQLWASFRVAVQVDMVLMALVWIITIFVVGVGYVPGQKWSESVWLMVLPGALYFTMNRFDALPTMFTAIAFSLLGRGHRGWAGVAFGLGVTFKMFPILFLPIVVRFLGVRGSLKLVVSFTVTVFTGLCLAVLMTDWDGTIGPIKVQLSRKLVPNNWTLYDWILPEWLGRNGVARLAIVALSCGVLVIRRPQTLDGVLRRCGILLTVFVSLAVFWSPQWMIWFLPLLVPLCRSRPNLRWFVMVQDLLTYFAFPWFFWILWPALDDDPRTHLVWLMELVRCVLWLTQIAWLAFPLRKQGIPIDILKERFRKNRPALMSLYLSNIPERGLKILRGEAIGDPIFAEVHKTFYAMQMVVVDVEPSLGKGLEDVAAARETRTITVVFTEDCGQWIPASRPVFNLMPAQVAERMGATIV
jgi:hypothetical protein